MTRESRFTSTFSSSTPYYSAPILCCFVSLFPIHICTTARNASKHSAPAEEALRHVLKALACNYLPRARRLSSIFILESEKPFQFHMSLTLHQFRLPRWASRKEGPGREWLTTTCPVTEDFYTLGTWRPFSIRHMTQP